LQSFEDQISNVRHKQIIAAEPTQQIPHKNTKLFIKNSLDDIKLIIKLLKL
jgi:hypothetical protein